MQNRLTKVYDNGEVCILKYRPSILHPFYINLEKMYLMKRIRFLIDLLYGYSVFYLKKDNKFIGYCTITSGKNPRYWFASEKDIIVGPYYTDSSYRGRGYATLLIKYAMDNCGISYEHGYDYILNDNIASIKTTEKIGGEKIMNVHVSPLTRKMSKDSNGEYGIYQFSR